MRARLGEAGEGLVEREDVDRNVLARRLHVRQLDALAVAPPLLGPVMTSVVDQDAPHGQGGGPEEVSPVVPATHVAPVHAGQLDECLMDESRRLQRVVGPLAAQVGLREAPQLAVDARNEGAEVRVIGPREILQDLRDLWLVGVLIGQ